MDFTDFAAGSDDGGRRVDRVLRRFLHGANLSSVYGALRKGLILVNARRVKPDARIESLFAEAIRDWGIRYTSLGRIVRRIYRWWKGK